MSPTRLADCPRKPNCVATQATRDSSRIQPLTFSGSPEDAIKRLKNVLSKVPRCEIVKETAEYLHAEVSSRLFHFIDDLEFEVDAVAGQIHFRSAARSGYYDFGVNRSRMERIRELFDASP